MKLPLCLFLTLKLHNRKNFQGEATDAEHYGTVHGAMSAAAREVSRLEAFWNNNQCSN
jgi:hypothetical protein